MEPKKTATTTTTTQDRGTRSTMLIVIIIVLLLINGFLLWQLFDKRGNLETAQHSLQATSLERDNLQTELDQVRNEFDRINEENVGLSSQLTERDEEIKAKVSEIQRLIRHGDAAQLRQARSELSKLKELNKSYLTTIDSLNTLNQELNRQNVTLTTDLTEHRTRVQSLSDENVVLSNKVAVGSMLKANDVRATGVKFRSSGKEVETGRAGQAEKIRTCFTLMENLVIDRGPKDIFVRILGPDGAILSTNSETFLFKGQPTIYSTRETIDYENAETDLCVYWSKGSNYAKGTYTAEIYSDGMQIGKSNFQLK